VRVWAYQDKIKWPLTLIAPFHMIDWARVGTVFVLLPLSYVNILNLQFFPDV